MPPKNRQLISPLCVPNALRMLLNRQKLRPIILFLGVGVCLAYLYLAYLKLAYLTAQPYLRQRFEMARLATLSQVEGRP